MDWEPRVGMRVVCVDGAYEWVDPADAAYDEIRPMKGQVLTIRAFEVPDGIASLWFVEIINYPRMYSNGYAEVSFGARRFRPLDERRLDIFRAVLTKAPTPEKEPA